MKTYLAIFGKPRYLGLVKIDEPCKNGTWVILKTMRGLEVGVLGGALSPEQEEKYRRVGNDEVEPNHGTEPMLQEVSFVAVAGDGDIKASKQNHIEEDGILVRSRELLSGHKLEIKLVEIEYLFDRKKLFFYFTAEHRVDFRAYVRDLAREFRTRIEMRQIGVRDEARTAKGLAQCGQPCCCSYWLHKFTPICIRMVKEQNLALNPTKISGLCGRLMCCVAFEHEMYEKLWENLPSPGAKLKTPNGNYVIDGIDIKNEAVLVGFPSGGDIPIPIADFEKFKQKIMAGEEWQLPEELAARIPAPRIRQVKEDDEPKELREPVKRQHATKQEKISLDQHLAQKGKQEPKAPRPQKTERAPKELKELKEQRDQSKKEIKPKKPDGAKNSRNRHRPQKKGEE